MTIYLRSYNISLLYVCVILEDGVFCEVRAGDEETVVIMQTSVRYELRLKKQLSIEHYRL
jgi:hypothetical protein